MVSGIVEAGLKNIQALRLDPQTGSFEGLELEPDGGSPHCAKRADPVAVCPFIAKPNTGRILL